MNKLIKIVIRIWIASTSVVAFVIGWVTLAHSQKPVALQTQTINPLASDVSTMNVADLPPIPSLEDLQSNKNTAQQPSFIQPSISFTTPRIRIRTRGS